MEYIINQTEFKYHNSIVALGKFEGLHLGHQLLFDQLNSYREKGYFSVVFTFDMMPKALITKQEQKVMFTKEERYHFLADQGIDSLIEYPFKDLKNMEARDFIVSILLKKLDAKIIVVGADFCFGKNRTGNIDLLQALSKEYGYQLIVLQKLQLAGKDVSSSRIREQLVAGEMEAVQALLGRPYSMSGVVIHGRQIGRTIGMPTANLSVPINKFTPPKGVYVAQVVYGDRVLYGIANLGTKPTIDSGIEEGLETYIFDFNEDIYGEFLKVNLLYFVRPELKFASIEELTAQMQQDSQYGKDYISKLA